LSTILGPQPISADGDYDLGPILDFQGEPVAFAPGDGLAATIWRSTGVRDEALATPAVVWTDAPEGLCRLSVNASDIAPLAPGDYGLEVTATPGSDSRPRAVLWVTLRLLDAPRAAAPVWPSVAACEELLIRGARETFDLAGMDASTVNGSNRDLGPPIAAALRLVGVRPASPLRPTDAELALVEQAAEPAFLLACRAEALEAALGRLHARVDLMIGGGAGNSYSLSQAAKSIAATIARLRVQFQQWYEGGSGRTEVAPIDSHYHEADAELLDPTCWW
jgi:hypothetical protein